MKIREVDTKNFFAKIMEEGTIRREYPFDLVIYYYEGIDDNGNKLEKGVKKVMISEYATNTKTDIFSPNINKLLLVCFKLGIPIKKSKIIQIALKTFKES